MTSSSRRSTSASERAETRAIIFSIRFSFGISKGRMTTRLCDGLRVIPVRLTSMLRNFPASLRVITAHPGSRETLPRLAKCRQGAFQEVHLGEREQEGERGFRSLVAVEPVFLKTIATAAAARVVQLLAQVVAAEEPLERRPSFVHPARVLGRPIGLEAGGNGVARLDRLLIEPRRLLPL